MLHTTPQRVAIALASLLLVASTGALAGRDHDAPPVRSRVVAVPSYPPSPTVTPLVTPTAEPAGVATVAPQTSARPAETKRPAPPPTEPDPVKHTGHVLKVSEPGIWVLDVNAKILRRVSDPAPFDVAGDRLFIPTGRQLTSQPVAGGSVEVLYTLPSLLQRWYPNADLSTEHVSQIDAAPDGTAYISSMATHSNGAYGVSSLVGSDGQILVTDIGQGDTEWSEDGTTLALMHGSTLHGYGRDGSEIWAHEMPEILRGVRWIPDGSAVVGHRDDHRLRRIDVPSGRTNLLEPLWHHIDFAPDGRALGQRRPPPDWSGRTHPGIGLWDPKTDTVEGWSSSGTHANWSGDGTRVWLFDTPLTGPDDGDNLSLRVLTAESDPILTVHPTGPRLRIVREGSGPYGMWSGPQGGPGNRIVFAVSQLP